MEVAKHLSPDDARILDRLRLALDAAYGSRIERVVLFGSRARGDAKANSDFDVAVFLCDYTNLWAELQPLAAITTAILFDTGVVISAKPFPAQQYDARTILMEDIRREGIRI